MLTAGRLRGALRRTRGLAAAANAANAGDGGRVRFNAVETAEQIALIPRERMRNFSIVAHIDHGKSTLADRLIELCGAVADSAQCLDTLQVERERGITVKAQTASLVYEHSDGLRYLLNLVDTPGHVDFSHEVARSLRACQGALVLVDSSQGIQAQTLATFGQARALGLELIPVLTKTDLPHSDVEGTKDSVALVMDLDWDDMLPCSAKTGEGVPAILPRIVEALPAPDGDGEATLRCLLVDSWFDQHRGVICLFRVTDGELRQGLQVRFSRGKATKPMDVQEVGVLLPAPQPTAALRAGQIGYAVLGLKTKSDAMVGDTLTLSKSDAEPLPGFVEAKCMLFASIYPIDKAIFEDLRVAVDRLTLNDASVSVSRESNVALGMGLRCGFLGLLHMEVFHTRLQQEFGTEVIITAPMVPYLIRQADGSTVAVESPAEFPATLNRGEAVLEPRVVASIVTPARDLGAVLELMMARRAEQLDLQYLDDERVLLKYNLPWQEVATDLHDQLKSQTAGYASFDYDVAEPQEADMVKVDMLVNGEALDALSFIAHRSRAQDEGRRVALKLRDTIDRQQYQIAIQAAVGAKVFARETIKPYRKDVLTKGGKTVGGGDVTRKRKLLEKQKRGKARMKTIGNVRLSQEAFSAILSR